MMKRSIYFFLAAMFVACSDPDGENGNNGGGSNTAKSVNGKIEWVNSVQMEDGPHDLLVVNDAMYACRDNFVYKFSLSNPAKPNLTNTFNNNNLSLRFASLFAHNGDVYAVSSSNGHVHIFDGANLALKTTIPNTPSYFKGSHVIVDAEGNMWIGGSDGSKGMIAKYSFDGSAITLVDSWMESSSNSGITWMVEKGNSILVSVASGKMYTFSKTNVAGGPVATVTYDEEPGHEKWGKTICVVDEVAYWANWGAGFAAVDVANPGSATLKTVLTNSMFKTQISGSEGTNVYDVVYNASKNVLCVANGWSGLFIVSPSNPSQVVDVIDPQYFQNYSVETKGDYVYTGNISGGMSGDLKGIQVFKLK